MSSLKDIAERANLSINTVSRAIRGSGYVSEDAKRKVMRIAGELGYRPNRAARSLRFRKNFEIAVISFLSESSSR
ncbi:MAG: LacI family DNA-binding transcriptional regulator, partial [Victivallaceae bacterium]